MSFFLPIIDGLNKAGVSYVIVDGLATVLHGRARLTTDVDIVLRLDEPNVAAAIDAILAAGFRSRLPIDPREFAKPKIRQSWITDKGMVVFSFFNEKNPVVGIDLFVAYPMDYDALFSAAITKDLGGVAARICSIDDLISMKTNAGRPKDLEDVKYLKLIRDDDAR